MKIQRIAPVQGVQELFDLLAFILDPEAVQKRLEELEAIRKDINDHIELYGKATQIDTMHSYAADDRAKASKELSDAQEKARGVVEEAQAEAKAIGEEASERAKRQQASLDAKAKELSELQAALTLQDASLRARESEVARKEDTARRVLAEGNRLQEEYEGKLAKLRAAGVA